MLKRILFALLIANVAIAQKSPHFEFVKADTVFNINPDDMDALPPQIKFGGISGLEQFNDSWYMVSDKAFGNKIDHNSYVYVLDSNLNSKLVYKFNGVNNAESIRMDDKSKRAYYSYETHDSTGVGYIGENAGKLIDYSMRNDTLTTENRGIESMMIGLDNSLWYAFESTSNGYIPFYKCLWDDKLNNYDAKHPIMYQYPFEPRTCLDSSQVLDSDIGNGLTEITTFKNDPNKIVALERCFNGKNASIKIFLCTILPDSKIIDKKLVFEFLPNNSFGVNNTTIKTDNMEGMSWRNGFLYIISDDNFNTKRQRTIMLKLKWVE